MKRENPGLGTEKSAENPRRQKTAGNVIFQAPVGFAGGGRKVHMETTASFKQRKAMSRN
jgi:hypothetical protein